ncbi:MAG: hypothetical protein FD145_1327 [Candidatus Saganbacteria bacterium]|uniref:Class I SAM-dependent methyltransferase n=1 Tax=Candidatus Saganbacteria bacterium TaxID=2575572 RepID=A0A833NRI5_UNCSA|nr:MAG: hypothetical protein FD145_1327 [Candidatus Saganbacteria bacterium]
MSELTQEVQITQETLDLLPNDKVNRDDFSPLLMPAWREYGELPKDIKEEVKSFFTIDVNVFIEKLNHYSGLLTKTLHFDLHTIYSDVFSSSEKILEKGEALTSKLSRGSSRFLKSMFRYSVWPYIKGSYFVERGLLKPHGFPGDYVIVEEMYNGNPKSFGLGYIFDTIFLQTQLCQGLRNRKEHMKYILNNFLEKNKNKNITIFNVACGGSRELRELNFPDEGENLNLYLMDFDVNAINFSLAHLMDKVSRASITPLNLDVRKIIASNYPLMINPCDLIYSIGLFDYLPDKILMALIKKLLVSLKDEGIFVFAHKDYTLFNPRIADWFCDWKYYSRSKADIEKLLFNLRIDPNSICFSREKNGYIYFVLISKNINEALKL